MKMFASILLVCAALAGCSEPKNDDEMAPPAGENVVPKTVVTMGTNPDYPPMEMIDPATGKIIGYEIDLMEAIADEGGFEIKWKSVEWKGIFGALERKDIDAIISAATITEERKKTYDFSDPYHTISQRLVVRTRDAAGVKSVDDLKGKKIGVQLATTGAIMVETEYPEWTSATYDNSSLAFADLLAGSVFGFMVDEPVADAYSRANPQTSDELVALPFEFSKEDYGIVVRKADTMLLDKINAGLAAVKEKGIDAELRAKWIK